MVSSGLKLSLDNLLTYIDQKAALLDLLTQLKKELAPDFEKGGGGIK